MNKDLISGFRKGMESFGQTISVIINSVLLTAVYLIGVGLTAVAAKLLGKRFLETKLSDGSYWSELNLGKKKEADYYREF
jgi:cytochrome c biogenesis protein CcdA